MSRQQFRHARFQVALEAVNKVNLKPVRDAMGTQIGWSGMKRADRRKLARAYAKGIRRAA
jgi:hypothetical protein